MARRFVVVVQCLLVEEFEAQKTAHPLVERLLEHDRSAGRENVRRVILEHRARSLRDDRARVISLIAKMHRAASEFAAMREHRFMHMMPIHAFATKLWQQCRMNINDCIREFLDQIFWHQ